MKKLTIVLTLVSMLACSPANSGGQQPHRVYIQGAWDEYNPDQYRAFLALHSDRTYVITNHTTNAITVVLVEVDVQGRTPLVYFPVMPSDSYRFAAPWNLSAGTSLFSLDLFLRGSHGINVNGRHGIELVEEPKPSHRCGHK